MTIGKVMDWTEARVDAIKAREEEEDEDEEREKDKERPPSGAVHVAPKSEVSKPGVQHPSTHRPKDTVSLQIFFFFDLGYLILLLLDNITTYPELTRLSPQYPTTL